MVCQSDHLGVDYRILPIVSLVFYLFFSVLYFCVLNYSVKRELYDEDVKECYFIVNEVDIL